jgi:hypothetical protein
MTPNATFTIVSGDNQAALRAMTVDGTAEASFAPLSVRLTDSAGAPLSGQQISWSPGSNPAGMAVQIDPSGAAPVIVTTDSNGVATLQGMGGSSVLAYFCDGDFTVVASYGTASATFHLGVSGVAPPAVTGTIISGNNQSMPRTGTEPPGGIATFAPLQVKVQYAQGNPVSGIQVSFIAGDANGETGAIAVQMSPSGDSGVTTTTDSNGIATLNQMGGSSMTAYYASGSFTVTVSIPRGNQVTFTETVASLCYSLMRTGRRR